MLSSRSKSAPCLALLFFLLAAALPVRASIWYVSTTGDDFNSGASWGQAKRHIGTALRLAHPKDDIWVANGRYSETLILKDAISLYGGFEGTETSLTARPLSATETLVSWGEQRQTDIPGSPAVINISPDVTSKTVLEGFKVINGGVGIYNLGAPLIRDCIIYDNNGGGIYNGPYATLTLTHCTVSRNSSGLGAGILTLGKAYLENCLISDNNPTTTISYDSFRDEEGFIYSTVTATTTGGGGITVDGGTFGASGCTIQNNQSANHGGGIWEQNSDMVIDHCKIVNNRASDGGGIDVGLTNRDDDNTTAQRVQIQHCIIAHNVGGYGGGISCVGSGSRRLPVLIRDNVIYANSGRGTRGGGVFAEFSYVRIINNTIASHGDLDSSGVTLYDDPSIFLANNILAFNRTGVTRRGDLAAVSHNNCVFGNTVTSFDNFEKGPNDFVADPRLADPPDDDYHILAGSPCIDAGDHACVLSGDTDVDGNVRTGTAHVSVGAYEYKIRAGLAGVSFPSPRVVGGQPMGGSVSLTSPAPFGGVTVSLDLSTGNDSATIPETVLVPAGAITASFVIQTAPVTANSSVTLEATYEGITKNAALTLVAASKAASKHKAHPSKIHH